MTDRNEEIVRLWNKNKTSSHIAKAVGVTRNTVIGVISRMREKGLITRPKLDNPKACGLQNAANIRRKKIGSAVDKVVPMPRIFERELEDIPDEIDKDGVTLMSLGRGQCRYPVGARGGEHLFCGEARRDSDTSYCKEHHDKCHTRKARLKPEDLIRLQKGYAMKQWISGSDAAYRKARNL